MFNSVQFNSGEGRFIIIAGCILFFSPFILTLPTVYVIFASSIFGLSVRNYFDVSPLFCKVTNNSEVWKLYSDLCWKDESQKDKEKVCLKALIVMPVRITLVLICCGRIYVRAGPQSGIVSFDFNRPVYSFSISSVLHFSSSIPFKTLSVVKSLRQLVIQHFCG